MYLHIGKYFTVAVAALLIGGTGTVAMAADPARGPTADGGDRPNILFIAIDDLNDWVGAFGGNRQVKTPHLDEFAGRSMTMTRAYAPSTVCCPSRTAILTGKYAHNTGVYGNRQNLKDAPHARDLVTLPEYFGRRGYHTLSAGKIFHRHATEHSVDEGQWAFHELAHPPAKWGMAWEKTPAVPGVKAQGGDLSWGATSVPTEQTKDYAAALWAAEQLNRDFDGKPFFLALGISKPHLPWYVPREFFDMYPLADVEPAPFQRDDFDDIVRPDGKPVFRNALHDRFRIADETGMHREANRAYLAAASYADACVGAVLEALNNSPHADNTIVMIWGDHGWYLGEKLRYGKCWLWEEAARVPFMVRVPGVSQDGARCERVVNLIDMYPTLVELCGMPANPQNDGRSFTPLLADPEREWDHPALTTFQYKNHSITDGRYRYTWYGGQADGAEELYDHQADPLEHDNLAYDPKYREVLERLKQHLPEHNEPPSPENPYNDRMRQNQKRYKQQVREDRRAGGE